MLHQRTRELRIYRHRARRKNKWRIEMPNVCSNPLPNHNCDSNKMKARCNAIIAREKECIDAYQREHSIRLWAVKDALARKVFGRRPSDPARKAL